MLDLIYFSGASEMTHRFVQKLDVDAKRIPLRRTDPEVHAERPFILLTPTYGDGNGPKAVPKQVIQFLNVESNRILMRGVVASGNTNFGSGYALAGRIIARKCEVPFLGSFELMGMPDDVQMVMDLLQADQLPADTV